MEVRLNRFKQFESYHDKLNDNIKRIKNDIEEILYDVNDEGYITNIYYKYRELSTTISKKSINLDDVTDCLDRVFDYMKNHQEIFRVNPVESYIITRRGLVPIGYAQFSKKYYNLYQDLKCRDFSEIRLRWVLKSNI